MEDFLDMMLAELQNQDPLDPMDNQQILNQIGQIREIVASDQLTETLNAVFLGQNLTAASSMMGQWVAVTDDDGGVVAAGQVGQVSIEDGVPRLDVAGRAVKLEEVSQIQSEEEGSALAEAMAMIGQQITGTSNATYQYPSQEITGWVKGVSLIGSAVKLHVQTDPGSGDGVEYTVDADNVTDVQ